MSEDNIYEVIVVGGGIIGSATSYYLSKKYGNKILLIEQFDFLHRRGSSHGETRIIRKTYSQEHYTFLMNDAYKLWNEVEKEYGSKVYTKTGGIDISKMDNPIFQSLINSAKKYNVPFEILNSKELTTKFPLIILPEEYVGLYSPDGGILNATKSMAMFHSLARLNGCKMMDNTQVMKIEEIKSKDGENDYINVYVSSNQIYLTKKVIVTTGAWTKKLLKKSQNLDLPLNPLQTISLYWKVNDLYGYSSDRFPVWIVYGDKSYGIYGCPAHEYPNMIKCAAHYGEDCDPDSRDFNMNMGNGKIEETVSKFLQTMFIGVESKPTIIESCMYTKSPDNGFIIDKIPSSKNIFIGCGFTGHGFKLAPVVGKILTRLVMNGEHLYPDIAKHFELDRFK